MSLAYHRNNVFGFQIDFGLSKKQINSKKWGLFLFSLNELRHIEIKREWPETGWVVTFS